MNMRLIAAATICAALVISCGNPVTDEQRVNSLEAERSQIIADLHRQEAECQAQQIEFSNTPNGDKIAEKCFDAYRKMLDISRNSIERIDRRIAEIGRGKPDMTYDPNWKGSTK